MWRLIAYALALASCGGEMFREWPGEGPFAPERFTPPEQGSPAVAGLTHPPDEFEVAAGQWGVDIDESRSVVLTGERSMWFKNTATISRLVHDKDHMAPVEAGRRYKAWAVFQADGKAAGQTVRFKVEWYAADKAAQVDASEIFSAVVTTANAWQRAESVVTAPAGAFYARLNFGRSSVTPVNIYFDEVDMEEAVPLWEASRSADQTITTSTDTVVVFNSTTSTIDVDVDTATGEATILIPGWYNVQAGGRWTSMADGSLVQMIAQKNGGNIKVLWNFPVGATGECSMHGSVMEQFAVGDTVRIVVWQNSGSDKTLSQIASGTYFSGVRIM